ncbi:MAG: DNA replication complex GINS family protein [bacterium]|nr:DNA replication complex GINS family protein [bacterium]
MPINITYETIFELLMREKNREELQKLDDDFFKNLSEYIADKNKVLSTPTLNVFSDEKDKTTKQVQNIYRMIRELYERREKKVVNLSIIRSRTGSDVIDTSAMLEDENRLFESVVSQLDTYRNIMLNKMTNPPEEPAQPAPQEPEAPAVSQRETTMVRFLHEVPKFVGKELEVYGPFGEEDIASLPSELANILIQKGRAEVISEQ